MSTIHSAYPWSGNPRQFSAVAMPNGDAQYGIEGQLVMLTEKRRHCVDRQKVFSRDEAEQLVAELQTALRTFDVASELATAIGCSAPYPFRDHRTVAEVEDC